MRTLPALITTELAKDAIFLKHLFKFVASTTYYWTDCDQDVRFDSKWWTAKGLTFTDLQYSIDGQTSTTTVTIPNVDKALSTLALGEELRNKSFMIYRVLLDNSIVPIGVATEADLSIVIDGLVDSIPSADQKAVQLSLISYNVTGDIQIPRRQIEDKCPWIAIGGFKGATYCKYAGVETWCDGSKARCDALANSVNFGGFEHISSLQNDTIYWGQRIKTWGVK